MRRAGLAVLYWGAAAGLALPLVLTGLGSLSEGALVQFPPGAPSLHWYGVALADPAWRDAFLLSAVLAVAASVLSVVAGGAVALALPTVRRRWMQVALLAGALLPLAMPGIVHAVALRVAAAAAGLAPGPVAVLLGHVAHAAPYAVLMVGARRAALPPDLLDAARDLGAGPVAAFRLVVLPWLRPSLLGAGALAGLSSFDDFVRSFFLGGYEPTLPVLVFARLRSGLTPEIEAVATGAVLLAGAAGLLADRIVRRGPDRGGSAAR